jgi:Zn-dependent protease
MPLLGGFNIGRWFGFPIRIDYSWFVLIALIVWMFGTRDFPARFPGYASSTYVTMAVAAALFFFLSLLLHELAHSVVARSRGIHVQGITLFIFGGVAQTTMEAKRPVDEFLLTVVGPLASFALAGIFVLLGIVGRNLGIPAPIAEVAGFLGILNLVLAVFNLVPGFPLDGGRILRAAIWQLTGDLRRATRWATAGGRVFGYALIALGVFSLLPGSPMDPIGSLWLVFIGWFLSNAAASSYRQFVLMRAISDVPVTRVARLASAVPAEMSARDLADLYVSGAPPALPVVRDGRMVGVVALDDVADIPPERRADTTAAELMSDVADTPVVTPDTTLDQVIGQLQSSDSERVIVAGEGRLHGILTLDEIADWVGRANKLGLDQLPPSLDAVGSEPEARNGQD